MQRDFELFNFIFVVSFSHPSLWNTMNTKSFFFIHGLNVAYLCEIIKCQRYNSMNGTSHEKTWKYCIAIRKQRDPHICFYTLELIVSIHRPLCQYWCVPPELITFHLLIITCIILSQWESIRFTWSELVTQSLVSMLHATDIDWLVYLWIIEM